MSLAQLVYVSTSVNPMTETQLQALVDVSVRNNARDGITGLLLYGSGQFMQLLEGEHAAIHKLMEKIVRDSRHTSVDVLLETSAASRLFADWNMGVIHLDQPTRVIDRERLLHVVKRAKIFRDFGTAPAGVEAMELLKYFRSKV